MLKNKAFFVANFKMYKTFKETVAWGKKHSSALAELAQEAKIVICPTFPALYELGIDLESCGVKIGAQTCAWREQGSLTGEVSVTSLKELGCSYCIVGHSERRRFCGETNEQIAQILPLLLGAEITPILCVGETSQGMSWIEQRPVLEQVLTDQLSVLTELKQSNYRTICIAYEPVWAIGTQQVPTVEHIQGAFACIRHFCGVYLADYTVHMLYGGSVDSVNAPSLWQVQGLEGFLVGGASVDFQSFQKIVQSHR